MSRYVVTGAAGFIGSHLADALLAADHDLVLVDSFNDYYDVAAKEENARGLDVARLDLADEDLELDGVDGVFHLAGQPGVRASFSDFDAYVRRNVIATQRVFEAAATAGVRVVFASSSSVYGEAERYPTPEDTVAAPISPYAITKLSCEHLARAYERSAALDAVIVRYFTIYGPRQRPDMAFTRLLEALAEGRSFSLHGDVSRSFTYVADAVGATIAAMERGATGRVYNVGGGEEATMSRVIELAEEISGRTLDVERGPAAVGDVSRTKADATRARDELGWVPVTPLREGLQAQWEWAAARVAPR